MAGLPRWRLNIRYISWRVATPSKTLQTVGELCIGGSSWPGRTESASDPPDLFVTSVLHHTSSQAASPVRRVKGRGTRAKLTLDALAGHAAALHSHFAFPPSCDLLPLPLTGSIRSASMWRSWLRSRPTRRVREPRQEVVVRAFRSSFQSTARGRDRAYPARASAAMARTRSA